MSSALEAKALKIRIPSDYNRTANDFGVKKIAVTATYGQTELAAEWGGRFVKALFVGSATGDLCHIGFSRTTGREVDSTVSATTAGATAKVGWPLQHGITEHFYVPKNDVNIQYLIHDGSTTGTLYLALADG